VSKRRFRTSTLSVDADRRTIGPPIDAAAEASVRQLIASGDPKAALEHWQLSTSLAQVIRSSGVLGFTVLHHSRSVAWRTPVDHGGL